MCFDSYHITCLDPPLAAKPSYDWYCHKHDMSHLLPRKKIPSVEINLPKDYLEEVKEKIEIENKENEVLQFLTNASKQPTEEKFSKEDVRIATEMIVSIATGISAQNNGSSKVDRSTTPTPPKRKRVSSESGAITKLVPLGSAGAKIQKVTPVVTPPTPKKKEIPVKTPIKINKKAEKDIGKIVSMMDIETLKSIAVQYLSGKSQDGEELIRFSKMAKDVLYKKDGLQQSFVKLKFEEIGGSKVKFDVKLSNNRTLIFGSKCTNPSSFDLEKVSPSSKSTRPSCRYIQSEHFTLFLSNEKIEVLPIQEIWLNGQRYFHTANMYNSFDKSVTKRNQKCGITDTLSGLQANQAKSVKRGLTAPYSVPCACDERSETRLEQFTKVHRELCVLGLEANIDQKWVNHFELGNDVTEEMYLKMPKEPAILKRENILRIGCKNFLVKIS